MPDTAQLNRSISTIRTELEFLRDSGVLSPQQLDSILAQLPVSMQLLLLFLNKTGLLTVISQQNGQQSQYVDPRYGGQQWGPPAPVFNQIAQQAQNPDSPAHPQNPNVRLILRRLSNVDEIDS